MKKWLSSHADILFALLEDLDTPLSLSCYLEIKYKAWDNLALRWVDPHNYPEGIFSSLRFRLDVLAVDLLRKAPLPTSFNRKDVALKTWNDCETLCAKTNTLLWYFDNTFWASCPLSIALARVFEPVKKRIARWLGPLPVFLEGGFGPGTCVEYVGFPNPTVVDKIWLRPTTTITCAALFEWHYSQTLWGKERWSYRLGAPSVSPGNRFTTVPKDGKTDRPICIEPLGNLWLQKGIGSYLKRVLRDIGLPDYRPDSQELFPGYISKGIDAQKVHRSLIRRCANEGFSTIDMSSASDTISFELIRRVFPADWFELLDDCRSQCTKVPTLGGASEYRSQQKFSSMGNGCTFEVESLVFCALLSVHFGLTPGMDLWVFGDDVILPSRCFDEACSLLQLCGFIPNRRKSFKDGPFFESCGGYIHGYLLIEPIRIKGEMDQPAEWYAFHNACYRQGFSRRSLRKIRDRIPRGLQFPGPEHLGDVVLHGLPFKGVIRTNQCPQILWVPVLELEPEFQIPLDRWSDELHVVALLLGSSTKVTRRGTRTVPVRGWTSIS